MTSNRPYLIRALFDWIIDNDLTPHLLVDATQDNVVVPMNFVEDGRIVLNINPGAVDLLNLDNEMISFNARFSGQAMDLFVPVSAVLGIYARENGQGMLFPEKEDDEPPPEPQQKKVGDKAKSKKRPSLKVVK